MMLNYPQAYSPPSIGLRKYSSRGSNLSRGSSCSSLDLLDSPTYSPPRLVCRKSAELTRGASCRTLEMLESPHPEHVTAIKSLCHQMQSSFGPCQVWATCDHDNHFSVAFLSTSLQAWLEYAYRCEDKVLLGVLSCMAQGRKSYVKVLRIGKNVPEDLRVKAEKLNTSSFQSVFNQKVEEVALHPEENHDDLSKKISSLLGCEPSHLRL